MVSPAPKSRQDDALPSVSTTMVTLGRTYGDKTPTHSAAKRCFGFGTTICFFFKIEPGIRTRPSLAVQLGILRYHNRQDGSCPDSEPQSYVNAAGRLTGTMARFPKRMPVREPKHKTRLGRTMRWQTRNVAPHNERIGRVTHFCPFYIF